MISVKLQEYLCFVVIAVVIAILTTLHELLKPLTDEKAARAPHTLTDKSDFFISFFFGYVFLFARAYLTKILIPVAAKVMNMNPEWDEKEIRYRKERFCSNIVNVFAYVCLTVFGYWAIYNEEWVPKWVMFGSHGDSNLVDNDFYFQKPSDRVRVYYLIEFGFTLASLAELVLIYEHHHDFLEMFIHHAATLMLIYFSYSEGFTRIGTLVLAVHDPVDIFAFLARAAADTPSQVFGGLAFSCLMTSWLYFRIIVFPLVIISKVFARYQLTDARSITYARLTFAFLLSVLYCLHIYWFSSFPKYVIGALKEGKLETDSVNRDVLSKEEEAEELNKKKKEN